MKYLLILLLSFPVFAEEEKDICETIEGFASGVMKTRQLGVSLKDVLAPAKDKVLRYIIIEAYKVHGFSTDKHQKKAVIDFSNRIYLECLEGS